MLYVKPKFPSTIKYIIVNKPSNTMSASSCCGLEPIRREDFKKIAEYATELTREWSLKTVGYDLTIKKEEFQYQTFKVNEEENLISWHDFSGYYPDNIPTDTFIEQITEKFPDTELKQWVTCEGPRVYEAKFKNGKWTDVFHFTMYVYVENDAEFSILAEKLSDKELLSRNHIWRNNISETEHFVELNFEDLTEDEQKPTFDGIISEISKSTPELFCIIESNYDQGNLFEKKVAVKNGNAIWQEITEEERHNLYKKYDFFSSDSDPLKAEHFKCLRENMSNKIDKKANKE